MSFASITGIVIGLLGIGLAIGFFAIDRSSTPTRALELILVSETQLAPLTSDLQDRITVHLDGQPVQSLWLTTVQLANKGNSDIGVNDFSAPLEFSTDGSVIEDIILATEQGQSKISPKLSLTPPSTGFILEPLLLKHGEVITFSMLTQKQLLKISPPSRVPISDVDTIPVVNVSTVTDTQQNSTRLSVLFSLLGVTSAIIATAAGASVVAWVRERNRIINRVERPFL